MKYLGLRSRRGYRTAVAACTALGLAGLLGVWPVLRSLPHLAATADLGPLRCAVGSRPGAVGRDDDLRTAAGLPVSVRTPANYDPLRAQPLLVVFPPAGFARGAAERYYGLTEAATRRGWIVAYPAPVPLSRLALALQQEVADAVARAWCVDAARVAYLGHSDGATVAEGLLLRAPDLAPYPRHVLASAAGLRGSDFTAEACPRPLDLTVVHTTGDRHFPGYGREAVRWWATCFACRGELPPPDRTPGGHCTELGPCTGGARVRYCEGDEDHAAWPRIAADPFRFFGAPAAPLRTAVTTPPRRF